MRDIDELKRVLREYFRGREEVIAVYLFGSLTRGSTHGLSDVDVAVLVESDQRASQEAAEPFGYKAAVVGGVTSVLQTDRVDVVILNEAPPLLAHEVIREGEILLSTDEAARLAFEEAVKKRYLDSQPLRNVKREYLYERTKRGAFSRVQSP
ncbi:MAG: nucleotidyltransferase domain-containing protein [Candidatus Bipolaricaulota bacterium]